MHTWRLRTWEMPCCCRKTELNSTDVAAASLWLGLFATIVKGWGQNAARRSQTKAGRCSERVSPMASSAFDAADRVVTSEKTGERMSVEGAVEMMQMCLTWNLRMADLSELA